MADLIDKEMERGGYLKDAESKDQQEEWNELLEVVEQEFARMYVSSTNSPDIGSKTV
jgi:hypothetical protein